MKIYCYNADDNVPMTTKIQRTNFFSQSSDKNHLNTQTNTTDRLQNIQNYNLVVKYLHQELVLLR